MGMTIYTCEECGQQFAVDNVTTIDSNGEAVSVKENTASEYSAGQAILGYHICNECAEEVEKKMENILNKRQEWFKEHTEDWVDFSPYNDDSIVTLEEVSNKDAVLPITPNILYEEIPMCLFREMIEICELTLIKRRDDETLEEFLEGSDIEDDITEEDEELKYRIVDNQGANLGGIEFERFKTLPEIGQRINHYFFDYGLELQ